MSDSRSVAQQYNDFFVGRFPDKSQKCINNLVKYLTKLEVFEFNEEVAGAVVQVLFDIHKSNQKLVEDAKELARRADASGLFDANDVRDLKLEQKDEKQEKLFADALGKVLRKLTTKIKKKITDRDVIALTTDLIKFDKEFQLRSFYRQIIKNYEDNPEHSKDFMNKKSHQELEAQRIAIQKSLKEWISTKGYETYHEVKDAKGLKEKLDNLIQQQKRMEADTTSDLSKERHYLDIQIQRINEHIVFFNALETKVNHLNQTNLTAEELIAAEREIASLINDQYAKEQKRYQQEEAIVKKIPEIQKLITIAKKKENFNLAQCVAQVLKASKDKETKPSEGLQKNLQTLENFSDFSRFVSYCKSGVDLSMEMHDDLKEMQEKNISHLTLEEIKKIAGGKKSTEQEDALRIVRLMEKLEIESNIDQLALDTIKLRDAFVAEFRTILGLPFHVALRDAGSETSFQTYIVKNLAVIKNQLERIRGEAKAEIRSPQTMQELGHLIFDLSKMQEAFFITVSDSFENIVPWTTLRGVVKSTVEKELKTITQDEFLRGKKPGIREKDRFSLDDKGRERRNKEIKEVAEAQMKFFDQLIFSLKMDAFIKIIDKFYHTSEIKLLIAAIQENIANKNGDGLIAILFNSIKEKGLKKEFDKKELEKHLSELIQHLQEALVKLEKSHAKEKELTEAKEVTPELYQALISLSQKMEYSEKISWIISHIRSFPPLANLVALVNDPVFVQKQKELQEKAKELGLLQLPAEISAAESKHHLRVSTFGDTLTVPVVGSASSTPKDGTPLYTPSGDTPSYTPRPDPGDSKTPVPLERTESKDFSPLPKSVSRPPAKKPKRKFELGDDEIIKAGTGTALPHESKHDSAVASTPSGSDSARVDTPTVVKFHQRKSPNFFGTPRSREETPGKDLSKAETPRQQNS